MLKMFRGRGKTAVRLLSVLIIFATLLGLAAPAAYGVANGYGGLPFSDSADGSEPTVNIDGRPMTLDELRDMVNEPGADMNRKIDLDGTEITLGDLKKMVEIEDELQRFADSFIDPDEMPEEQRLGYESILQQLQTTGISVKEEDGYGGIMPMAAGTGVTYDHTARLTIEQSGVAVNNGGGTATITVTRPSLPYTTSFYYKTMDGNARAGENYEAASGTVTFAAGETSKTISIEILHSAERWNGERIFLVQFSNARNILFDNGYQSATAEIYISNSYNYDTADYFNIYSITNRDSITVDRNTWGGEIPLKDGTTNVFLVPDISDVYFVKYWVMISESLKNGILDGMIDRITLKCTLKNFGIGIAYYDVYAVIDGTEKLVAQTDHIDGDFDKTRGEMTIVLTPAQLEQIAGATRLSIVHRISGTGNNSEADEITVNGAKLLQPSFGNATLTTATVSDPAEEYSLGQQVPVTVNYSRVTTARDSTILMNGNVKVPAVSNGSNRDRSLTYLYTVTEENVTTPLAINKIEISSNLMDTKSGSTYNGVIHEPNPKVKQTLNNARISMPRESAIVSASTEDSYPQTGGNANVEILLDTNYTQWMEQAGALDKLKVSVDGGATLVSVGWKTDPNTGTVSEDRLTATVQLPANTTTADISRRAEVFLQDEQSGEYDVLIGKYKDFKVLASKYPTGISIDTSSYPPGNVIYMNNPPKMNATLVPAAAAEYEPTPVITWSSTNEAVATINPVTGQVNAAKEGKVKFTASVQGATDVLTAETAELEVKDSGEPFIDLPAVITTRKNTATTVTWTTNVVNKMQNKDPKENVVFTVTVKNLNGETVYTKTTEAEPNKTSWVIPDTALTVESAGDAPAYTVTVTCPNPDDAGVPPLTDTAGIVVRALPLVVRFDSLNSYYITDVTKSVPLTSSFINYDTTSGVTYRYKVMKNGNAEEPVEMTGYKALTQTFNLSITPVTDRLRDIYIVSIEAYNPGDERAPSTDSFILYVYQNGVIDITADGVTKTDGATLTLDNNGKTGIANKLQPVTETDAIAALRENANLQSTLSIDSHTAEGYAWNNVEDQIRWNSSDDSAASLNYQQGGFYGNIKDYDYTSYRPSSEFMLVGHSDGTAKITATHAKTGEQTELNVDVTTLKDKLYVFNIFPRKTTTLEYKNGNGESRKLETNYYGEIAIYEPSGIKSDISASSGSGDDLMMGTIYSALLSSEKDPSKMELYPVNIFKLRPAAKVELFILKEDGTPFTGDLTVSGGVYKNGKYCEATEIRDEPYTLTSDGKLTITMDPDKFWTTNNDEGLTPSDQLDYVFIARSPNDGYYPLYIKVDGSVGADDSVVFATNAVVAGKVPADKKNKPFISAIAARHADGGTVWSPILRHNGVVGITDTAPGLEELELNTTVLWWGEVTGAGADYSVYLEDASGKRFDGQRVSAVTRYPFSDLAVSENVTVLNENTILAKAGETLRPKIRLQKGSSLVLLQDAAFTLINGVGLPDMTKDENLQDNLNSLLSPGGSSVLGADGSDTKFNQGGDMSSPGLAMLFTMLKTDFSSDYLTMKFKPTSNPLEWEFYIQVGVDLIGDSNTNADGEKNNMMIDQSADKFKYLPGPIDAYQMIKGTFAEKTASSFKDAIKSGVGNEKSYGGKLGGFYEGLLVYENGSWKMRTRSGGFTIGAAFGYTWNVNTWVGPIPVVASASVGAGLEVDLKILMTEHGTGDSKEYLQNQLVTMRINAYIKAFVGIGFDYSVVAIKFGVFGQVDLKNYNAWLTKRKDDGSTEKLSGQYTDLRGTVGIEFYLKILFIQYRKILASREFKVGTWETGKWGDIETWRKDAKFPNDFGGFGGELSAQNLMMAYAATAPQLETVSEGMYVEDRDYLGLEERVWGGGQPDAARLQRFDPQSIDDPNKLENLQSNAYPYANPFVTDNGNMVVFLSDGGASELDATRVEYTLLQNGAYAAPQPIVADGTFNDKYADSNLQFDSKGDMSVAAWQSQTKELGLDYKQGQAATADDLNAMMNAADIYAGVYKNNIWVTTRLTANDAADMAPVTATNGDKAIVIWRRLAATSTDNVESMEFDARDDLMYRVYNGAEWEDEKQLYNGTSGAVKGISAAMDDMGNTLVAYTVDTARYVGNTQDVSGQKLDVAYSLIASSGAVTVPTMFLTNDAAPDENPQVTTATLNGAERFITAWYTQQPLADDAAGGSVSDIRLRVIDSNGFPYDEFPGGINEINQNSSVAISNQFRFGNSASGDIEDLTLVWIAPEMDDTAIPEKDDAQTMDKDSVYAIRFLQENAYDPIYVTAPMSIVEAGENTKVDHVDAYLSGTNEIKAVLQTTTYDIAKGYETITLDDGRQIIIATPISAMKTATGELKNAISAGAPIFDYAEVRHSIMLPLQVTVANQGKEAITAIKVTTQDTGGSATTERTFKDFKLMPNSRMTLIVYHPLADEGELIKNIAVETEATFRNGDNISASSEAKTQVADTGIGSLTVTKEENKARDIQIKLYNQSEIELDGMHKANSNYDVKIGFYKDNLNNTAATGVTLVPEETGMTGTDKPNVFTVDADRLTLIDNGAFVGNFRYALPTGGFENGDIQLYAAVWIEDTSSGESVTVTEVYAVNNAGSVSFTDPVERNNGEPIQITTELSAGTGGKTVADITVKNLAWLPTGTGETGGNLIAALLDSDGNPVETQQSVILQENKLIQLDGEDSETIRFEFSQVGETVNANYVLLSKNATDNTLSALRVGGVALEFNPYTETYEAEVENLFTADVTAIAAYPGATVTARLAPGGGAEDAELVSTGGVLSGRLSLNLGDKGSVTKNVIEVTVTPAEGTGTRTYSVTLHDTLVDDTGSAFVNTARVSIEAPAWIKTSGEMPIPVSLSGFTAKPVSYTIGVASAPHGERSQWLGNAESGTVTVPIPDAEGRHELSVRVYDEQSYYTDATATVTLDTTAPEITDIAFEETETALEVKPLQSSIPTQDDGITDKQLKVHFKVMDAGSGVDDTKVKVIAGDDEYTAEYLEGVYTATVKYAFTGDLKLVACDRAGNETETGKDVLIDDDLNVGEITTGTADTTQTASVLHGAATTEATLIVTYGIQYRAKPEAVTADGWADLTLDEGSQSTKFSASMEIEPDPEKMYEYRAYIQDTIGNFHYGDIKEFSALPCACTIEDVAITNATDIEIPLRDKTTTIDLTSTYRYENNDCTAHNGAEQDAKFTTTYKITEGDDIATLGGYNSGQLTVRETGTVAVEVTVTYSAGEMEVASSTAAETFTVTKQDMVVVTGVNYDKPTRWNPGDIVLELVGTNLSVAEKITVTATARDVEEDPITADAESGNTAAILKGIQNTSTDDDKIYDVIVSGTVQVDNEDQPLADYRIELIVPRALKTGAEIIGYSVEGQLIETKIDNEKRTITVVMPRLTKLTELSDELDARTEITYSPNAAVTIESREVSGAALTVIYRVTSEDGATVNTYTARISIQPLYNHASGSGSESKTAEFPVITGERVENSDGSVTLPNGGKLELENGMTIQTNGETTIADDTVTMVEGVTAVITQPGEAVRTVSSNYTIFTDGSVRWNSVFDDVTGKDWYFGDVEYVYENKLFTGTAEGEFRPGITANRAMLATVLWRMAGSPTAGDAAFNDVDAGSYYYDAVLWAAENGIVNGVGEGKFAPNADVTREQLATLIYRYAAQTGREFGEDRPYDGFADADGISGYAAAAVKALYCSGIVNGKSNGVFDPQGKATRAEIAAIIHRFLEYGK